MKAEQLREMQAPFKAMYREVPEKAVTTALELPLRGGTVRAEGDLDFRGTLGVDKAAPVGFREIRLTFDLDSDAPEVDLDSLVRLTQRYCVVFQTLAHAPALAVSHRKAKLA